MHKVFTHLIAAASLLTCSTYFFWREEPVSRSALTAAGGIENGSAELKIALPGVGGIALAAGAITPGIGDVPTIRPGQQAVNPLIGKLTLARGARHFVIDTLASQGVQSLPYAWRVLEDCRRFLDFSITDGVFQPNMAIVPPGDQAAASAAFSRMQVRCELFTPDEIALVGGLERVFAQSKAATLNGKILGLLAQGTDTSRREALQLAVDADDPLLWDTLGSRLLLQRDQQGSYLGYSGKKYYVMDQVDVLAVIEIVPCLLGLPCGADASDVSIECALGLGCFQSRLDKMQTRYAGVDKEQFSFVLEVATAIATANKGRDLKALNP